MGAEYEVLVDGATIHHDQGEVTDVAGNVVGVQVESVIHHAGDRIPEEDLPEYFRQAYADGDEHTSAMVKKVGGSSASSRSAEENEKTGAISSDTTVAVLDELGKDLEGYPADALKPEKIAFLEEAGVTP